MTEQKKSFWRRHKWVKWVGGGLLLALAGAAVLVSMALHRAEPYLRARIVEALENRFHARVELDGFHVSLVKGLWAEGHGLRIWPPARVDGVTVPQGLGEPLIRLDEFRFHAPLRYRPGEPIHLSVVELKGLNIDLAPRSHFAKEEENMGGVNSTLAATDRNAAPSTFHPSDENLSLGTPVALRSAQDDKRDWGTQLVSFVVEKIECSDADLVMETNKPGKLPMEFLIAHVTLTNIASGGAMGFDAQLTNPRPRGTIYAQGSFGPWLAGDPGETPLAGDYRLEHATLASFKGIAGTLDSTGHYQGTLRNLTVDGETRTPDFRLTHFGSALPLTTHFHALVDGTNGDTRLEPVEATLGRSHFTAQGLIARVPAEVVNGARQYGGHDIALTVNVDRARIEDFLRLTSKSDKVLMTGDVAVKTKLRYSARPRADSRAAEAGRLVCAGQGALHQRKDPEAHCGVEPARPGAARRAEDDRSGEHLVAHGEQFSVGRRGDDVAGAQLYRSGRGDSTQGDLWPGRRRAAL